MTAATLASPQQRSENIMSHDEAPRMVEGLAIGMPLELIQSFRTLEKPGTMLESTRKVGHTDSRQATGKMTQA